MVQSEIGSKGRLMGLMETNSWSTHVHHTSVLMDRFCHVKIAKQLHSSCCSVIRNIIESPAVILWKQESRSW